MHYTTFINNNAENNIKEKGQDSLERTIEALEFWRENGTESDSNDTFTTYQDYSRREIIEECCGDRDEVRKIEAIVNGFKDNGDFHEYGLSFDFVESTEENDGFYRFQMSCGGPSDEVRFYPNRSIEYVYLDWFCGVGFNCNQDSTMKWLKEYFEELGLIDFDSQDYNDLFKKEHEETE